MDSSAELLEGVRRASEIPSFWAARTPEAIALMEGDRALNYAALAEAVAGTAEDLRALGVRGGDRVALVTENIMAAPILMFAAQSLDAWPAFVNARIAPREVEELCELIEPRVAIFRSSGGASPGFQNAALAGMQAGAVNERAKAEPVFWEPRDQTGLMLFTSGTTGRPKAVRLSQGGLVDVGATLAKVRHVRPGDRHEGAAPLSHIMGVTTLMSILSGGACLRLTSRVDVPDLARQIAAGSVTHLSFVPTVFVRLLEHIRQNNIDLGASRLEYVTSGGAPLDPALRRAVEETFRVRLINAYGMTECAPIARTPRDRGVGESSVGFAEPGTQLRIVGADGKDMEAGDVGELWARSVGSMQGYYRNPEATREAIREGGWIATGDLGSISPEGELSIVGRKKEMIIRSGFNVYPIEVEAAINQHPAVLQSAVAGLVREDRDEDVVAFVQLRPDVVLSEAELIDYLRARITAYKRPNRIYFRAQFPLGATGKILKRQLVDELKAGGASR